MSLLSNRGFRPLVALDALYRLLRDHDDTTQVFRIIEALKGRSDRSLERFRATPVGAQVLAERRSLVPLLSDTEALAALPEGSLGRVYLDFMTEQGITAGGLAGASADSWTPDVGDPDVVTFRNWNRDIHDLWHVTTGYGPDPLGELCLLAFTYAQLGSHGTGVIAALGGLHYQKEYPKAPVLRAVLEGWRHGRRARFLPAEDWAALLPLPLDQVRDQLGVRDAATYRVARAPMPAWKPRGAEEPPAGAAFGTA